MPMHVSNEPTTSTRCGGTMRVDASSQTSTSASSRAARIAMSPRWSASAGSQTAIPQVISAPRTTPLSTATPRPSAASVVRLATKARSKLPSQAAARRTARTAFWAGVGPDIAATTTAIPRETTVARPSRTTRAGRITPVRPARRCTAASTPTSESPSPRSGAAATGLPGRCTARTIGEATLTGGLVSRPGLRAAEPADGEHDTADNRAQIAQVEALEARPVTDVVAREPGERAAKRRPRLHASAQRGHEQAQVAGEPAHAQTERRSGDVRQRPAARPLELQAREVDARTDGNLDRLRQPRVDLHEKRRAVPVAPELDLGVSVEADLGDEALGGRQAVLGGRARPPHDRRAADERRPGALDAHRHARHGSAGRAEELDRLAAARRELLHEHGRAVAHERRGEAAGMVGVERERRPEPLSSAAEVTPRALGLEDARQPDLLDRGQRLGGGACQVRARNGDAERARHLERPLLAERDLDRVRVAERRRREPRKLVAPAMEHLDARVDRGGRDVGGLAPQRVEDGVAERAEIVLGRGQSHAARRVAGAQARRAAVARGDRDRDSGPAEGAGGAEAGSRVEVEDERAARRRRRHGQIPRY